MDVRMFCPNARDVRGRARGAGGGAGRGAAPLSGALAPRQALWTPGLAALAAGGVEVVDVSPEEMTAAAGTETPQGVLLVVEEPRVQARTLLSEPRSRLLLLDGVQDPGNVGTLVRAAAAFACTGVLVLDGTADPWGSRAVRAAAGTTFRIPVACAPWPEVDGWLHDASLPLLTADAGGRDVGLEAPRDRWALAVGGEGSGCRPEVRVRAEAVLAIPMPGGVESLNVGVAGAILLHELSRGTGT
ncbi:MAG: RNA methyltransferase [Longimicrobiales bacterium]|nr:RNA methyltransferase [Longimicrobiales bacterium]